VPAPNVLKSRNAVSPNPSLIAGAQFHPCNLEGRPVLKVIPLGGLGEVGMNAMVLEFGAERLLVDCGLMFPRADELGVEVVLPDFGPALVDGAALTGVVLTHAHEDHLGALPWLLREQNVPVYGTPFTLALARHKLDEAGLSAELRPFGPGERARVGATFEVEPVRVTHSVPDAVGLVVRTPAGTVVHTGDFKLDGTPIDGRLTDLERLGEVGDEGVALLLSDSTNAEVPGHSGSERLVRETFERLLREAPGRVVIAMFGSHLYRVQHALELARAGGRRAALLGRSLQRNVELAQGVGVLERYEDVLVRPEDVASLPDGRVLLLCTGAQAEPRSALMGLVAPEPGLLRLHPGDTVVLSSRTIPGNEPAVSGLINALLARGVRIITARHEPGVHVSGHGARDEQRRMLEVVRPRHFVPIHGELRHLHAHLAVAHEAGLPHERLLLATDGDVVGLDAQGGRLLGRAPVVRRLMRRDGLVPVMPETLKERRALAESGVIVAVVVLQLASGRILTGPTVHAQGLQGDEQAALPLAAEGARLELDSVSEAVRGDDERVREAMVRGVRRVFKQLLGSRPAVLPLVLRVP
jgi:ribonuclease J